MCYVWSFEKCLYLHFGKGLLKLELKNQLTLPVGPTQMHCSLALRQIGIKKREIFRNLYCNPGLTAYFPVAEVGLAPRLQTNMSNIKVRFKIIGIKSQNDKYI